MMCVFMGSAKASVTGYVQVRLTNCATENTLFNLGFIFVAQICFAFPPTVSNIHYVVSSTREVNAMGTLTTMPMGTLTTMPMGKRCKELGRPP